MKTALLRVLPLRGRIFLAIMVAAIGTPAAFAQGSVQAAPLMRDFMGINGHFTFRPDLYRPVCGLVRNYHPTVWVSSTETEQAQWIVRSYLVFSSLGLDRAYLYFFNDSDEPMLHGSSGITRNFTPKPAYYAMAHLYKTLGDYRFSRAVREDKDDLYIFEYTNPEKPAQPVWAIWSPTGTQRTAVKQIAIPGKRVKAETMPLQAGAAEKANFQMAGANLQLRVTESPVYLWLDERP